MAAPSIAAFGSDLTTATSNTAAVPVPSGVANNSIIVVTIGINHATYVVNSLPDGFAEAAHSPLYGAAAVPWRMHVFWKRATGADTGTYDFGLSGSGPRRGKAMRIENCVTTGTPYEIDVASVLDTYGADLGPITMTTTVPGEVMLWLTALYDLDRTTITAPGDFTTDLTQLTQGRVIATRPQNNRIGPITTPVGAVTASCYCRFTWAAALKPDTAPATAPMVVDVIDAVIGSAAPAVTFTTFTPAENDVVLIFASSTTSAATNTVSGWVNVLGEGLEVESDAHTLTAAYHLVTAAEASAVTMTYTISDATPTNWFQASETGRAMGVVVRGINPASVIDSVNSWFDSGAATPHVMANLVGSNLSDNSIVLSAVVKDGTGAYQVAPPAGWMYLANLTTTQGHALLLKDALTTAGSNIDAVNITPSAGDEGASITIALTKQITSVDRSCALAGTGTLTVTTSQKCNVVKNFSGTGTLTATAVATKFTFSKTLTGAGALTVTVYQKFNISKTLPGAGALTVTEYQKFAIAKTLTGTGTLTASTSIIGGLLKMGNFSDTFDAGINTPWGTSGASVTAENGAVRISHSASAGDYQYINTSGTGTYYDITGSFVHVEVKDYGNQALETHLVLFQVNSPDDADQMIWWAQHGNLHAFYKEDGGSLTEVLDSPITLNTTDHCWLRIREAVGTVYWDTSPDSQTWTNRFNFVTSAQLTSVYPQILCGEDAADGASSALFDNFNVPSRTAVLGGTGALTATAVATKFTLTASLTGQGALTAARYPKFAVTKTMTGVGVLTATATMYKIAVTKTLPGTGSLTVTKYQKFAVTRVLTGTGTLTATAVATKFTLTAAKTGMGSLTVTTTPKFARSVALSGTGALTTTAAQKSPRSVVLSGIGTLTVTARMYCIASAVALSGHGVLSATASAKFSQAVSLFGHGVLSASATIYRIASAATLSGHGALTATTVPKFSSTLTTHGTGVLTTTAQMYRIASSVSLQGSGALTATDKPKLEAALNGTGVLAAVATMYRIASSISLAGHGSLTVITTPKFSTSPALPGHGTLSVTATMYRIASTVATSGAGQLTVTTLPKFSRSVTVSGHGSLTATALAEKFTLAVSLGGYGILSVEALAGYDRNAYSSGTGILTTLAQMYRIASATSLLGHGTLSATATPRFSVSTVLSGHSSLTATATMYRIASTASSLGHGSLTTAMVAKFVIAPTLPGQGVASASAQMYQITAAFQVLGHGELSVETRTPGQAVLSGDGVLTAVISQHEHRASSVSGTGILVPVAIRKIACEALLSGSGTTSAQAQIYQIAAATGPSGIGILSATALATKFVIDGTIPGTGVLTTEVFFTQPATVGLSGVGVFTAVAELFQAIIEVMLSGVGMGFLSGRTLEIQQSIPVVSLFDSFAFQDNEKWYYQGSAQVVDSQLQLGSPG